MGCNVNKGMILTNNNSSSVVAANGYIPLGGAVHGIGTSIRINGNNITLLAPGNYYVDVSATISASAATMVGVQLTENGVPVVGAVASAEHAADVVASVSFPWVVHKGCCGNPTQIGFILTEAGTVENITVRIIKA